MYSVRQFNCREAAQDVSAMPDINKSREGFILLSPRGELGLREQAGRKRCREAVLKRPASCLPHLGRHSGATEQPLVLLGCDLPFQEPLLQFTDGHSLKQITWHCTK